MNERRNVSAAVVIGLAAPALMYALKAAIGDIFVRMAVFYAITVPVTLLVARLDWRKLLRFDGRMALIGALSGLALWAIGWAGFAVIGLIAPDFASEASTFYGWLNTGGGAVMWLLILWVIVAEEIVWRMAVTLPLAGKWKAWGVVAGAVGFAAVHLPWGPPLLLLAALVFGACWGFIAWRTRSFWCVLASHLVWDLLVMKLLPYA